VIAELFRLITEAFAPWIQPLDNNGQMLSPWIISDDDIASQLVADWLTVVNCLFTAFTGRSRVLSSLDNVMIMAYFIWQQKPDYIHSTTY